MGIFNLIGSGLKHIKQSTIFDLTFLIKESLFIKSEKLPLNIQIFSTETFRLTLAVKVI